MKRLEAQHDKKIKTEDDDDMIDDFGGGVKEMIMVVTMAFHFFRKPKE